jgi:hypothetical protein
MYLTENLYEGISEYEEITGRDPSEATEARVEMASRLLDARIGIYDFDEDTGYKLDLDTLLPHQRRAVKIWVAGMIVYLFEHNDQAPTSEAITLGRFSVSGRTGEVNSSFPEQLTLADHLIATSGLVNRRVSIL